MTKKIYKLEGSERIFYTQAEIEAESLEQTKEIYYWEQCALEKRDAGKGRYIPLFDRQEDSKSHI
ncbi:MAG: hypothetical protein UW07_C0019G0014 [Candidatus Nomurabacteria bacterium GW2011_GWF2_43_8]|uniref:Uncharacterized protein n=3 Tax=Parcubacteria group TaxID=1794811 RepID=A0A0G1FNE3_9BACT|nr:MAG: hypothetical protein UW02_C0002G0034 [Candidatus Nomurabacteria bacterium GW2011_GWB1_43_7]KKT23935.1 MAG: hypothetical protein UW07_C0019G0014 [Candidatus Nomurabacteria bacterium GW2011_GWF2_43_8]KKU05050.1 MAG: hypothetical protein UX06_C0004G0018 [Candidatus Giovannonibacteria bacterium GW2011_GWA2_45_21]